MAKAFQGSARRATLSLGLGHLLNWFPVQVFSVLGTTVITSVHKISFTNSLFILILSNLIAYTGYLTHGFFGDKFGRRQVIAVGWFLGGVAFTAMLFGPSNYLVVVALYSVGQFFLIGPYSCVLFFVGESYSSGIRGTGSAIVNGVGSHRRHPGEPWRHRRAQGGRGLADGSVLVRGGSLHGVCFGGVGRARCARSAQAAPYCAR